MKTLTWSRREDGQWIADTGTAYSLGHDRLLMLIHWTVTEGFQSVMRYY